MKYLIIAGNIYEYRRWLRENYKLLNITADDCRFVLSVYDLYNWRAGVSLVLYGSWLERTDAADIERFIKLSHKEGNYGATNTTTTKH